MRARSIPHCFRSVQRLRVLLHSYTQHGTQADRPLQPDEGVRRRLAERFELMPTVMPGDGPARYVSVAGTSLRIGFITPISQHSCAGCNRVRLSTACAGPRDARQDFQVSLAHSVRAGATIPGLAPLARASAARRSSGARFRRAPDARPPWLYGAMAWLLRPPGRAYLVLLAIGASHLPWLAAMVVVLKSFLK